VCRIVPTLILIQLYTVAMYVARVHDRQTRRIGHMIRVCAGFQHTCPVPVSWFDVRRRSGQTSFDYSWRACLILSNPPDR
jgi:hypothetical protein